MAGIKITTGTDGHVKVDHDIDDVRVDGVPVLSGGIVSLTAASTTLTVEAHAGRTMVFNKADGCAAVLPAATGSGALFRFIVGTVVSGGDAVIDAGTNGADLEGTVFGLDGTPPTANGWTAGAANDEFHMDGTTQGGKVGDWIEVLDIAADRWAIRGCISQSGSDATPFEGS